MKYTRIKREDAPQNVVRLPRLGKIRLGVKAVSGSGKEYPKETDYFVCPPEIQARHGEKPTIIPVMVPTENEEMFCRQYYAVYGSNQRLKCQGDGETYERRENGATEKGSCPTPKDCEYALKLGKNNQPACRARMDLMVVVPDVACGGVYQISTGSINSDIDIRSGLQMARSLYNRISWVPMEIRREPMKIADPESGKMNTHWPVKLYPVGDIQTVMQVRKDPLLIPAPETNQYEVAEPKIDGEEPDTPIEFIEEEPNAEAQREPLPPSQSTFQQEVIDRLHDDQEIGADEIRVYITGSGTGEELRKIWNASVRHLALLPAKDKSSLQAEYDMKARELKKAR